MPTNMLGIQCGGPQSRRGGEEGLSPEACKEGNRACYFDLTFFIGFRDHIPNTMVSEFTSVDTPILVQASLSAGKASQWRKVFDEELTHQIRAKPGREPSQIPSYCFG